MVMCRARLDRIELAQSRRMLPEQGLTAYVHSASPVERGLQYRLAFVRLN